MFEISTRLESLGGERKRNNPPKSLRTCFFIPVRATERSSIIIPASFLSIPRMHRESIYAGKLVNNIFTYICHSSLLFAVRVIAPEKKLFQNSTCRSPVDSDREPRRFHKRGPILSVGILMTRIVIYGVVAHSA